MAKTKTKKAGLLLAAALGLALAIPAGAAERLDRALEEAAKCSAKTSMPPSLAAYRLLLSSKVVVKERLGPLTFYAAAVDRQSNVKLWQISPTRIVVLEREGVDRALVGSLYSKDFPLTDAQIVGSFQGGLNRKINLAQFSSPSLVRVGLVGMSMSTEPVANDRHMLAGRLASGDRLVVCGTRADFEAFIR